ncbi:molybdopterin-dependent oxidoreductase [Microbaculum sp. FT89]|uniref:molybdopterin-dependent oxidoreductase n=1 Tax=Microbaculum sp. FT89 TaxID=3447298 RepID=UPI003F53B90F
MASAKFAIILIGFTVLAQAAQAGTNGLDAPAGPVVLEVRGNIGRTNTESAARFDLDMLKSLPQRALETSTTVTDGVRRFDGFLMRDLLALVEADGGTVTAIALNDYVIDIPADDFTRFDVLVAFEMDGDALHVSDKGPLWIVYPRDDHRELQDIRYDYRWVWQLYRLEIR